MILRWEQQNLRRALVERWFFSRLLVVREGSQENYQGWVGSKSKSLRQLHSISSIKPNFLASSAVIALSSLNFCLISSIVLPVDEVSML